MEREEIKIGFTNIKYKIDNKIVIEKKYNGFNHRLDYRQTQEFDFVPKLLFDNNEKQEWEYIDSTHLNKPSDEELVKLAKMIRTIHKSDIKLPKNNLRQRTSQYLKIIHDKKIHIPAIDSLWREMNKILTNMQRVNPTHNDLWYENILKDKQGKIWLVDWEYASMGDKHFDLAFFIESNKLDQRQEKIFLDSYHLDDNYQPYNIDLLPKYKKLCHWITILWAYAQDKKPFDTTWMENFLLKK